ncbi:hypothetical protein pb186bvf_008696 [Paramecium bursaria]
MIIKADDWLQGEAPQVQFQKKTTGKKGQVLVELQKSFKGDDRFKLNERFQDLDEQKLSKRFKDLQQDLLEQEEPEKEDVVEELDIKKEIDQQLNLLSELMPEERNFIQYKKKQDKKNYDLIIQRFDPTKINKKLIVKKQPISKQQEQQKKVQITKGLNKQELNIQRANQKLNRAPEKFQIKTVINKNAWKDLVNRGQNVSVRLFGDSRDLLFLQVLMKKKDLSLSDTTCCKEKLSLWQVQMIQFVYQFEQTSKIFQIIIIILVIYCRDYLEKNEIAILNLDKSK